MTIIETTYNKIYGVQRSNLHTQANIFLRTSHSNQSHKSAPTPLTSEKNCGTRHDASTKELAISMRREGKTYGEILAVVHVAKSTLSIWLKEVGLSVAQKQHITERRVEVQKKGARVRHEMAVEKREQIYSVSRNQIGNLTNREIWLLASMAYWAEGSKEKKYAGSQLRFGNMDPRMIRLFLYWLMNIQKISLTQLKFEIYLHENNKHRVDIVRQYWANELKIPINLLGIIRFKKHKVMTKRKNIGDLYYGLFQVTVVASSTLVRQIEGWTQGIDCFIQNGMKHNP
jgi:hypothetical protein